MYQQWSLSCKDNDMKVKGTSDQQKSMAIPNILICRGNSGAKTQSALPVLSRLDDKNATLHSLEYGTWRRHPFDIHDYATLQGRALQCNAMRFTKFVWMPLCTRTSFTNALQRWIQVHTEKPCGCIAKDCMLILLFKLSK